MACNCNKKLNPKYGEGNEIKEVTGVEKIGNAIIRLFFGFIIAVILVVSLIPISLYMIFCICTGKRMSVEIPNLNKFLKSE